MEKLEGRLPAMVLQFLLALGKALDTVSERRFVLPLPLLRGRCHVVAPSM